MGSISLLQGIFPTQGSNPGLPHCRWILYRRGHQGPGGNCCWHFLPIARMGPPQFTLLMTQSVGSAYPVWVAMSRSLLACKRGWETKPGICGFYWGEMKFCFLQCNSPTTEGKIPSGTAKANAEVL